MNASQRRLGTRLATYAAATVTVVAGTVFVAAPANAKVTNWTSGGVTYRYDSANPGAGAAVTAYTPVGAQTTVSIKDVMPVGSGKVPVRTIASNVFANENNLKKVFFVGTNLRTIGSGAFLQSNVDTAALPSGLTTIGVNAFRNVNLKKVVIPNTVTTIGAAAYYDGLVESVTIGNHVSFIGNQAFLANGNLRSVRFTGPSPTYIAPADGGVDQSFETDVNVGDLVVHYPAAYHNNNYSFPNWHGYKTMKGLDPSVNGNVREGLTITADSGTVVPSGAEGAFTTFTYQWYVDSTLITTETKKTIYVQGKYAGHRLRVVVTSHSPLDYETKSSAQTPIVSSAVKRIVVSDSTIKKGQTFTVTCTGFTPGQAVRIYLDGKLRSTGFADSNGTISKGVSFVSTTATGKRAVRVDGFNSGGVKTSSTSTTVSYSK